LEQWVKIINSKTLERQEEEYVEKLKNKILADRQESDHSKSQTSKKVANTRKMEVCTEKPKT
jgi:hypothetical protein